MKKTIIEWFDDVVDKELRGKLLKYYDENWEDIQECSSLSGAICYVFNWANTTEGEVYWSNICDDTEKYPEIYLKTMNKEQQIKEVRQEMEALFCINRKGIMIKKILTGQLITFALYTVVYLVKSFVLWEFTNPFDWIINLPTYLPEVRF